MDAVCVHKTITIDAPPSRVFDFWADFRNFPKFIPLIDSVEVLDERHSRWTVKAPLGKTVEFDSRITVLRPNERLCWETRHALGISHGSLRFSEEGAATRVDCDFDYAVKPFWLRRLARLMSELGFPSRAFDEGLRRIKHEIEEGV